MSDENPLADEIRQARRPKLDLALPARGGGSDEDIEQHARSIGSRWGAATQLPAPDVPLVPTAPLVSVRFDCPNYLDKAVAMKAVETGSTKTFIILKALQHAGFEIAEQDLVADRRKTKRR